MRPGIAHTSFAPVKSVSLGSASLRVAPLLKGFPEAIESIFPRAQAQLCVVHLLRNSLGYVSWKERKAVAAALKPI